MPRDGVFVDIKEGLQPRLGGSPRDPEVSALMSQPGKQAKSVGLQTYCDAALTILRSASHPLSTREITELAIAQGLIAPRGRTPVATMSAVLYRRAATDDELVRISTPGKTRAMRGTVRWTVALGD